MSKEEYEKIIPEPAFYDADGKPQKVPRSDFTIAEINSIYEFRPASIEYDENNKLESFRFTFSSRNFSTMLTAIKDKFPKLKCKNSTVSNAYGAKFNDINCNFSNSKTVLKLTKYIDLDTSVLTMKSHQYEKKEMQKYKKRTKDL
jgi:hypothetical protein